MKNQLRKFVVGLLAIAMVVSSVAPAALAVPATATGADENTDGTAVSSTAETNLASAKIVASLEEESNDTEDTEAEVAVKEAVFNNYNDTTDVSEYNISSTEMESATQEVLEENNMTELVEVTYETDAADTVTTVEVKMDQRVALAADELEQNSTVYNFTEEQTQNLIGLYAQYTQAVEDNADIYGVQVAFNTTKDTNASPIGSLLDIASISEDNVDYDTVYGLVQIYYLSTVIGSQQFGDQIRSQRDQALACLDEGMSDIEKYLALNDWLANHCTFAMASIMEVMEAPQPTESQTYQVAYNFMYNMIKQQVYDQVYNALVDSYGEEQAKAVAEAQATSYMEDQTDDPSGNGSQQAASTAETMTGLWQSTTVGAFVEQSAVCLGYTSAYAYLIQCAFPEVYLNDPNAEDLYAASNWKSYEQLNYALNEDGTPQTDENGDYVWSADSGAIVDNVKIIYDADVSMFGAASIFASSHYWNAVKADGKWYYIDPCYTDIYIECMMRDRVETDGNMNHLYFMISDTSVRKLYDGSYSEINTLYENIATDTTYEDSWFAFAKSPIYQVDDRAYYMYDSTDVISMLDQYGDFSDTETANSSTASSAKAADDDAYGDLFGDAELKVVYHDLTQPDSDASYVTLVDFNNGQIYDPAGNTMVDNELIAQLYTEYTEATEQYPSIAISTAYYEGKVYFSISDTILSYDLATGELDKLIEYTEVSGERDMTVAMGGMAFTMTDDTSGENTITVKNPPIADLTIKEDGNMYVSVATCYGFVSGKGEYTDADGTTYSILEDDRSFGYQFAETNYNSGYNAYYNYSDDTNDNDEFMWSANIVGVIDMDHLTGSDHSYSAVTVPSSCTDERYTVSRCSVCGLIETESGHKKLSQTNHTYIEFDETYYTKDDNGNWNTGTCYSCIECGKSCDEDELDDVLSNDDYIFDLGVLTGQKINVWTYSSDYTEAAMYRVATELDYSMFDCIWENADVSTRTVADVTTSGDCVNGLTYTYQADVDGETFTETKEVTPGTHTYSAVWTWAEDYSTATLNLTCDVCGHTPEAIAGEVTAQETPATCEAAGAVTYTATASYEDVNYKSTRQQEIAATGHAYGDPAWEWIQADDGSYTAKATFTCANDASHVETKDATVAVETDQETGVERYVATVEFNGQVYTSEHDKELMITSQPTDVSGEVGTNATFTVVADGSGVTYQWQYQNADAANWRNSSQNGNKTGTLTVPITEARNGQKYRCIVTDAGGNSLTSAEVTLTATPAIPKITITTQPTDVTGEVGTDATFTVVAEGNELTYQWQYLNVGATNWRNSSQSGSNTNTLTIPITEARNGQQYRCVITDVDGNTVTSDAATLTATAATPKITTQPADFTGEVGTDATFTVVAEGDGLTYQWQYLNVGATNWRNSSQTGNNTNTLTIPITEARNGQQYRCVVTNADGHTSVSEAATLTATAAIPKITITTQPADFTGEAGIDATFTVVAEGNELTYQWQYLNVGATNWRNSSQSGNKTDTLTIPITEARNGQQYRCVITDADGNTITSDAATLIVAGSAS